ncbi:hypothetical protein SDC9_203124 [bioreactor metagenome]|uniref:Uncharacterized protein n=1 Tax=bioreactor metagenome TaxID=1076179 RepID=A0A645IX60_9ZZZZ
MACAMWIDRCSAPTRCAASAIRSQWSRPTRPNRRTRQWPPSGSTTPCWRWLTTPCMRSKRRPKRCMPVAICCTTCTMPTAIWGLPSPPVSMWWRTNTTARARCMPTSKPRAASSSMTTTAAWWCASAARIRNATVR